MPENQQTFPSNEEGEPHRRPIRTSEPPLFLREGRGPKGNTLGTAPWSMSPQKGRIAAERAKGTHTDWQERQATLFSLLPMPWVQHSHRLPDSQITIERILFCAGRLAFWMFVTALLPIFLAYLSTLPFFSAFVPIIGHACVFWKIKRVLEKSHSLTA